jgi:hypothetical protein
VTAAWTPPQNAIVARWPGVNSEWDFPQATDYPLHMPL